MLSRGESCTLLTMEKWFYTFSEPVRNETRAILRFEERVASGSVLRCIAKDSSTPFNIKFSLC